MIVAFFSDAWNILASTNKQKTEGRPRLNAHIDTCVLWLRPILHVHSRNGMAKQYDRRDYAYNFKKSQKQH